MVRFRTCAVAVAAALSVSSVCRAATSLSTLLVSNGQLNQPSTDAVIAYDAASGKFLGNFIAPGNGLDGPRGLAYGANGNLYVANNGGNDIMEYNEANGSYIGTFVAPGADGLSGPEKITFHGSDLYVASYNSGQVLKFNGTSGAFDGVAASGEVATDGFAFDTAGNLYVASAQPLGTGTLVGTRADEVDEFDTSGNFIKTFASGFGSNGPRDVLFDASGNALISTPHGPDATATVPLNAVEKFSPTGADLGSEVASGADGLTLPRGLAFGPNGDLFVSSQNTNAILEFNSTNGVSTFATGGGSSRPTYFTFADVSSLQQPTNPPPPAAPLPAAASMGFVTLAALGVISLIRQRSLAKA